MILSIKLNIDESEEKDMLIMAAPKICSGLTEVWSIVGWVLWVFKIVIPIIIIIFGMIDLGKAVVASKDDEIKKSIKSLAMRAVAGIVIFFVPSLVSAIFGLVDSFQTDTELQGEYGVCETCIKNPSACGTACPTGKSWDEATKSCK